MGSEEVVEGCKDCFPSGLGSHCCCCGILLCLFKQNLTHRTQSEYEGLELKNVYKLENSFSPTSGVWGGSRGWGTQRGCPQTGQLTPGGFKREVLHLGWR